MELESDSFAHGDIEVQYFFRGALKDCRHLIVIFSGFRPKGTVDFAGTTVSNLRANILWVVDDFDHHRSYYLRGYGGRDLSPAVTALIEAFRTSLNLSRNQVTLAGFSKGGTAALYYAIQGNYPTAVVTVPQLNIGSYVENYWPGDLDAMGGSGSVELLNGTLEEAILSDRDQDRNIYFITSTGDEQFETEAKPLMELLRRYTNVNLVVTQTPFINTHVDVTRYNIPLILALLALLSEGFTPTLVSGALQDEDHLALGIDLPTVLPHPARESYLVNGSLPFPPAPPSRLPHGAHCAKISQVSFDEGVLNFQGLAYFRGVPIAKYGEIATSLVFSSASTRKTIRLGSLNDPNLSLQEFDSALVDYSHSAITTIAHTGIPLESLPIGKYDLSIASQQGELSGESNSFPVQIHNYWALTSKKQLCSRSTGKGSWQVLILPAVGRSALDAYVEEVECSIRDGLLFIEGYFIPRGHTLSLGGYQLLAIGR